MVGLGSDSDAVRSHSASAALSTMRFESPKSQTLQIGIPACDELAWLPNTLTDLAAQTDLNFEVWICVNHSQASVVSDEKQEVVLANLATIAVLRRFQKEAPFRLHILDATGRKAPGEKVAGVGWARRTIFETILAARGQAFVGISLDADTRLDTNYINAIRTGFDQHPNAVACAVPYYHELPKDPSMALQLLRYEIYLRYYHLNLWRIESPYALTALGSALAFRAQAYQRVGGFPLRQAGEDFYLLQQLRKMGPVISWLPTVVKPASRVSQRVPFGTGILLAAGALEILETRFPFYALEDFERIGATYAQWLDWYATPQALPIQEFLDAKMGGDKPMLSMRGNATQQRAFSRACHGRLDGLKLLQCLRFYRQRRERNPSAASQIQALLKAVGGVGQEAVFVPTFETANLMHLGKIRDQLWLLESCFQRRAMEGWSASATW